MQTAPHSTVDSGGSAGSGLSDRQLEARLNGELATLELEPTSSGLSSGGTGTGLGLGGGGGGYAFNPGQLDAVIAQWHTILQRTQRYDQMIGLITSVTSAAADGASTAFTARAQTVGTHVQATHASLRSYTTAYIAKLQESRNNYVNTEHAVTASLNAIGEGLGR